MLRSVTITNPKDEALEIELNNPEKSGLIISNIEGLGSPQANINGQEIATSDGMIYSSARAQTRNIMFNFLMYERNGHNIYGPMSIEESRQLLYKYFPLKKEIKMEFKTDLKTLYISGYIEEVEPTIFSKGEGAHVSVVCPYPYFKEASKGETIFAGAQPAFEFPFSNESLTEPLLEFSVLWYDTRATLHYRGNMDSGVIITIHAVKDGVKNITLYNFNEDTRMKIDTSKIETITGKAFSTRDDIIISTYHGDRYCKLFRNGVYTNIIACLDRESDWFQITAGDNQFAFYADEGEENISVTFSYDNIFVGL